MSLVTSPEVLIRAHGVRVHRLVAEVEGQGGSEGLHEEVAGGEAEPLGVGPVRLQEVAHAGLRPDQHVLDEVVPGELEPAGDGPVHAEQGGHAAEEVGRPVHPLGGDVEAGAHPRGQELVDARLRQPGVDVEVQAVEALEVRPVDVVLERQRARPDVVQLASQGEVDALPEDVGVGEVADDPRPVLERVPHPDAARQPGKLPQLHHHVLHRLGRVRGDEPHRRGAEQAEEQELALALEERLRVQWSAGGHLEVRPDQGLVGALETPHHDLPHPHRRPGLHQQHRFDEGPVGREVRLGRHLGEEVAAAAETAQGGGDRVVQP
jgi:hypothetical protein